jgi:hypothetical protein
MSDQGRTGGRCFPFSPIYNLTATATLTMDAPVPLLPRAPFLLSAWLSRNLSLMDPAPTRLDRCLFRKKQFEHAASPSSWSCRDQQPGPTLIKPVWERFGLAIRAGQGFSSHTAATQLVPGSGGFSFPAHNGLTEARTCEAQSFANNPLQVLCVPTIITEQSPSS